VTRNLDSNRFQAMEQALRILAKNRFSPDSRRPIFSDVLGFLRDRGFELYDVASLSARPRDGRLRQADGVFVRRESPLSSGRSWD